MKHSIATKIDVWAGSDLGSIFGSSDPFPRWSWYTYARRARRSMNVARKRACARWKVWAWEQNFAAYADAGLQRICADCGVSTSPRDPVFDLCRSCERVYLGDR